MPIRALRSCEADHPEDCEEFRQFLAEHRWPVVLCLRSVRMTVEACNGEEASEEDLVRHALTQPSTHLRLRAHRAWPSITARFLSTATSMNAGAQKPTQAPPAFFVMGAKGVGKSTCCRFIINKLLNDCSEVCLLETDIGQPELSPPGLVSLHRLRKPLLQVPHAEQNAHECIVAFFAGAVTPSVNPALYVKCVKSAYDAYLQLYRAAKQSGRSAPPLVINSHGWVNGLGLELTRTIIKLTEPLLLLRLRHAAPRDAQAAAQAKSSEHGALRQIDEDGLGVADSPQAKRKHSSSGSRPAKRRRGTLARCGPLASKLFEAAGLDVQAPSASYVLVDAESSFKALASAPKAGLAATEMRWLRFQSYFRPETDPCQRPKASTTQDFFRLVPRLHLPLAQLRFGQVQGGLVGSEVEAAFTGAVVAICRSPSVPAPDAPLAIWEASDTPLQCIAMAIVHSFDFKRGHICLLGPKLESSARQEINVILRGDIAWEPHSTKGLLIDVDVTTPIQPYCCSWLLEGLGSGARVQSTRGNLRRRQQEFAKR